MWYFAEYSFFLVEKKKREYSRNKERKRINLDNGKKKENEKIKKSVNNENDKEPMGAPNMIYSGDVELWGHSEQLSHFGYKLQCKWWILYI